MLSLLAGLIGLVLIALSPAAHGAADATVRLRFVFAAMDEVERAALLDGVARFEAANPGIEVEAVPFQWSGYGFHDTLVRLLALQDPSVDVYRIDTPWIPELAAPGWLLPLEPWLDEPAREAFVPVSLAGGAYQGVQYGLPLSLKGSLLFYRRDLLDRHGLTPPTSVAELGRQASLLRQAHGLEAGLALHPLYLYNDVLPVLWASGGRVLSDDGVVALDSETNRAALDDLAALFGAGPEAAVPLERFRGPWSERYAAPFDDFAAGQAAFVISWSQRWHELAGSPVAGSVGVVAIPGLEDGQGGSNLGSWYLAVSRFSEHPDAAAAFVRFMAGPEAQRGRLELNGEVPSLEALLDDAQLASVHPELASMEAVLRSGSLRPRVPDERALGAILEDAFHAALTSGVPADQALADAARTIAEARLAPSVAPADPAPAALPVSDTGSWLRPLVAGCGGAVALLLGVGLLLVARARLGLEVLVTLRGKLLLSSAVAVAVLALSSTGIATSLSVRAQQVELTQHRAFFAERVRDQATSQARNLGLALALLDEQLAVRGEDARRAALAQLLMASQFSEDVLFLELLDVDGERLLSDRDATYAEAGTDELGCPGPEGLADRAGSRQVRVYEHRCGDGPLHTEVLVPVFRGGVHRGALRLGFSRARFEASLHQAEARHAASLRQLTGAIAGTSLALLLVCLVAVALLARRLTRPVTALTESAARIRRGELDTTIEPDSRDELGTLAVSMAEMVQGLRDRDFIRDAFGRYLTRELAERLVEDPSALELGGHERTVTVLMSDLRGFCGLTERLGPEGMVALLNGYFGAMTEVVVAHRGMINDFIGDAILVLFGALDTEEDDADRALRCALDMQRALRVLNERNAAAGLPVLAMGIGVNTGVVVAGNIGSEQRVKYGVVGTPVNMAARLESLTTGGQVLVSDAALVACRGEYRTRGPNQVAVKGSAGALVYHELLGVPDDPDLDADQVTAPVVAAALPARLARLEGKRVPDGRHEGRTVVLGVERLELDCQVDLAVLDVVVLELELPDHGWTRSLYGKVLAVEGERIGLAITSVEPDDLVALRRLVEAA